MTPCARSPRPNTTTFNQPQRYDATSARSLARPGKPDLTIPVWTAGARRPFATPVWAQTATAAEMPCFTMAKWKTDTSREPLRAQRGHPPTAARAKTQTPPIRSQCYDDSVAIRPQNTTPTRSTAPNPYDASLGKSTIRKKSATKTEISSLPALHTKSQ